MAIRNTDDWIDSLRPKVRTLGVAELAALKDDADDLVVVDIRELQERLIKGAIPGAVHVPRGMLEFWADPALSYHRDFFREDRQYVVHCAAGSRSVLAAIALSEMGYSRVAHLGPGFDGWAAAGEPVEDIAATSKWVRREES